MGISVRMYVFEESGPIKRVPQRVSYGLPFGEDAIPEYAGTRQRVAQVVLDNENGKPVRILDATGHSWTFDAAGRIDQGLMRGAFEAMETFDKAERASRARVVDLRPKLARREWEQKNRWDLSKEDLDRIAADLWPNLAPDTPEVGIVKGKAPKKPPLTYEGEHAMREANRAIFDITYKVDDLSEPALKGFAFEARRHAKMGGASSPIWEGVAVTAERKREIKARRRSGKGTWYASCRLTMWSADRREGREIDFVEEQCDGKQAAIEAARRLLAAHAARFSDDVTVEVELLTDLEWQEENAGAQ